MTPLNKKLVHFITVCLVIGTLYTISQLENTDIAHAYKELKTLVSARDSQSQQDNQMVDSMAQLQLANLTTDLKALPQLNNQNLDMNSKFSIMMHEHQLALTKSTNLSNQLEVARREYKEAINLSKTLARDLDEERKINKKTKIDDPAVTEVKQASFNISSKLLQELAERIRRKLLEDGSIVQKSQEYYSRLGATKMIQSPIDVSSDWINSIEYYLPPPGGLCAHSPTFIFLVHSVTQNFVARRIIRETWGSLTTLKGRNDTPDATFSLGFLLGRDYNVNAQAAIHKEYLKYNDVIQADYRDSYDNLTMKSVLGLKFASEFCSKSKYFVKVDDDVFINAYSLVDLVPHDKTWTIFGRIMINKSPQRTGKWAVTEKEYNETTYPNYAIGGFYLITMDAVPHLYRLAMKKRFFHFEDVFINGILAAELNITRDDLLYGHFDFTLNYAIARTCNKSTTFVGFHKVKAAQQKLLWDLVHVERNMSIPCPFL